MSIGTFGSFTQARLGIYAAQTGLSVTGNNISNINTIGYTRQRLDQTSLYAGGSDRYYSANSVRVGNGVLCTGVSQLRDPYLDIRFRGEMASVGAMDSKLHGLESIQKILDEVGKGNEEFGVLGAQFDDFFKQLQNLNDSTGSVINDTQVRSSAEALAKLFNSYANDLNKVYDNAKDEFKQDIEIVNGILTSIRDLNATIRKAEIHGDSALELRDERNMLIDQLSSYMKIDVTYEEEDVGGQKIEKLVIKLGNANPDPNSPNDRAVLVDGIHATQLSVPDIVNGKDNNFLLVSLDSLKDSKGRVKDGSTELLLDDNDLYGSLQSQREFLTEAGEFASAEALAMDPDANIKKGIVYYQKTLDLLANQFAAVFNEANQGFVRNEKGEYVTKDGAVIMKDGKPVTADMPMTDELKKHLMANGGQFKGGPLFSNQGNGNDTTGISASNISISKQWSQGPLIVGSFTQNAAGQIGSTDSSNIAHMLVLMTTKRDFTPDNAQEPLFKGTFNEMWINIGAVLGKDMMLSNTMLNMYKSSAVRLDSSRDSVSSVDLNDEAMNMMQYSKSYNAACRLMTTIDSILDKLINGTGVLT